MPTVRKTTPGTVTIHNAGTFHQGTTRDVPKDTADYLVENRSDFERVHDGGTEAEDGADARAAHAEQDLGEMRSGRLNRSGRRVVPQCRRIARVEW